MGEGAFAASNQVGGECSKGGKHVFKFGKCATPRRSAPLPAVLLPAAPMRPSVPLLPTLCSSTSTQYMLLSHPLLSTLYSIPSAFPPSALPPSIHYPLLSIHCSLPSPVCATYR